MAVRKYLFWMTDQGIRTYKVVGKSKYELIKFKGKDINPEVDLDKFAKWFYKTAAITADDYIDFCYLSEKRIDSEVFKHQTSINSSWDKKEINAFCSTYLSIENYEVFYSEEKSFVCQNSDLHKGQELRKIYLKCIPEFNIQAEEQIEEGSEETSLVNQLYFEWLKELGG